MAAAEIGRSDWAWAWWRAISPAHRVQDSTHPARGPAYGGEPFLLAGDIYTAPPWTGRCGWSWYTGSAGWLWRAGVESLCGVQVRQQLLRIEPCLPRDWPQVEVRLEGIRLRLAARGEDAARWRHEPGWRGALPARQWLPLAALRASADGGFYVIDLSAADDSGVSPRPTRPAATRHET
jgi:cyclic beta-1,2-glucan synthetase